MANQVNHFKGLREARTGNRPPYMEMGFNYELELDNTYIFSTQKKGDAFIAEFIITKTDCPNQKVGSRVGWYRSMTDKTVAWPALKSLFYACLGLDENDPNDQIKIKNEVDPSIEEEMNNAVGTNHMKGAKLACKVEKRLNKDTKEAYGLNIWRPV